MVPSDKSITNRMNLPVSPLNRTGNIHSHLKREEGRGKRAEGRGKSEEGRGKREE